jgi:hypothetical protein
MLYQNLPKTSENYDLFTQIDGKTCNFSHLYVHQLFTMHFHAFVLLELVHTQFFSSLSPDMFKFYRGCWKITYPRKKKIISFLAHHIGLKL